MDTILLTIFCTISLSLFLTRCSYPFASPSTASICLSPSLSVPVIFHLIHPRPPLDPPTLDTLTRTHISPTDCLSSTFCSTPHHNRTDGSHFWLLNYAQIFLDSESNGEWKNVNTRALRAIDWLSRSHSVWLVGTHHLLRRTNVAAHPLSPALRPCSSLVALKLELMITIICRARLGPLAQFGKICRPSEQIRWRTSTNG